MSNMKLGGGGRFRALQAKIEAAGKTPQQAAGIAANAGRAAHGQKAMTKYSKMGKK